MTTLGFFLSSAFVSSLEVVITDRILTILLLIIATIMVLRIKKADNDISNLTMQSVIDPLTQAKNSRAFGQEIENEIARDKRYHRSLSIAIIDIDHLKMINEDYDSDQGDHVIQRVAEEIENNIRRCDILYRLGGGKFAVLFAETGVLEAKRVGDVVCKKIFSKIGLSDRKITVSVGIAALSAEDNKRVFCQRAEEALLQAKRNGRNKVSTLPPINNIKETSRVAAILSRSRFN
ncbi:MAG: GGDEF domain-containing protein [Nitrosomonas sp.]|nr:GGDEF domain-containing protein [Nitrosomonas sp.]